MEKPPRFCYNFFYMVKLPSLPERKEAMNVGKHKPFSTLRSRIACYFVIALLPLILLLGYAYVKFVRSESQQTLNRMAMTVQTGVQSVDTSIEAAKKACLTLFYDNRVKRHLKPISESTAEDRVAQVEIHSTINSLVTITDAVTETMLMYLDDEYVFSDGLYSFTDYFNTFYCFEDYDADYWRGLLDQRMSMKMLSATQLVQKRLGLTKRVIPIVYTTRVAGRSVVTVITISVENMVSTVKSNLSASGVQLVLLDKEGNLVYSDFDPALIQSDDAGGYAAVTLAGEKYHLIADISDRSGLQYYVAVPDSVIYAMSEDYLFLIIAALLMSIVAGTLAIYFAQKISRPIQHIYSSIDGKAEGEPKSLQEVSRKFSYFLSNYQEAQEEEKSLRANFVEVGVLRLLSGHDGHIQDLMRQLERECAFTDPVYQLCVIEVAFSQLRNEVQDTERINVQLNFRNDLNTYLNRSMPCLVLEDRPDQYICLVNRSVEDDALYEAMERLLKQVEDGATVARMHICVAQGTELKKLGGAYEKAMRTLAAMGAQEPYCLCRAGENSQQAAVAFTLKDEMKLLSALRGSDKEKVYALMREVVSASARVSPEQEKLRIHDLYVTGMRYLAERDGTLLDQNQYQGLRADVDLPGGMEAKQKLLNQFYHELTEIQSIGAESNLTASIVDYVQQHYASDLYLERIAEGLGLSVKYISKVFKDKTGRNLSDYINEVRIQHVKEMLVETDMSIASISEAAGIYSRSTLIRLFRKYEGVTPSEYRELMKKE